MSDLSTTYLGFELPHPVIPGAGPLADDLAVARALEDAGAPMIVMHSLFEEQITREQVGTINQMELHDEAYGEALSYFPDPADFRLGPEAYLDQIGKLKAAVSVPVVASLNGTTPSGWLDYAKLMQEAGADALELNIFRLPTSVEVDGRQIEDDAVEAVRLVAEATQIPIAAKLSPYYSAIPHLVRRLEQAGAAGVVLFNRFYQPDIDLDTLEAEPWLRLSTPAELLLRVRWAAILSGQTSLSLAISGGVHRSEDAIKAVMAGAHCTQVTSALLRSGPGRITEIVEGMHRWLDEREYASLREMLGSMSMERCPDPQAFTRANYMRILQSWPE